MTEADRIKGYVGPVQKPGETETSDRIDSKQFQDAMKKVQESDEAEKRQQRRKPRKEEEGEEEVKEAPVETPTSDVAFSEFMQDKEKVDSIFDAKGGKKAVPETEGLPSPYKAPLAGARAAEPPPPEEAPPPPPTEEPQEAPPPTQQQTTQPAQAAPPPTQAAPPAEEAAPTVQKTEEKTPAKAEKKAGVTPTTAKKATPSAALPSAPGVTPEQAKEEVESTLEQTSTSAMKKLDEEMHPPVELKSKEEEAVEVEGVGVTAPEEVLTMEPSALKKLREEEMKAEESGAAAPATPELAGPVSASAATEVPPYANLPPQVYALFERMVGILTIQQHSDKTTTTVTVNMKGSVFDGTEITITRYKTDSTAFHIQLASTPQAMKLLTENIAGLNTSLAAAFAGSQLISKIHVQRPVLKKEYHQIRRKSAARDKGKDKQGK